ncbi:TonB-dependent receptor [Sanyastnella coralliicola]|uniref:TonB-dependent receptor n=1 Tax=Sanyastnella coralliicola TaxID=3069118 RepID=UPI0027BA9320|nr:TonB-dependent receptor [Longitalea sp. SCSIO 12813]
MKTTIIKPLGLVLAFSFLFLSDSALAQKNYPKFVKGKVTTPCPSGDGGLDPLPGANVYWKGTQVGEMTDAFGFFKIRTDQATDTLVFSFVGYTTGYVLYEGQDYLEVTLAAGELIDAAEVVSDGGSTRMEMLDPRVAQTIDRRELTKAACCNLSESFETNASVDASFTDAVTGTRQIKMLGLDGKYVEMTKDNLPAIRGLATIFGLYNVPGPWVDQIHISKGVGSVTSGYESMTGQINVALKNPVNAERVYLNLYGNQGGRGEINFHSRHNVGRKWGTILMYHTMYNNREIDNNKDGFMDNPLKEHAVLRNQWMYAGDRGLEGQYTVTGVLSNIYGGQMSDLASDDTNVNNLWRSSIKSKQFQASAKTGYVFPGQSWKSFGSQFSGEYYEQNSNFGERTYRGVQRYFRGNVLYSSIIGNTNHKFTTGVSYIYDSYDEDLDSLNYVRTEQVPGAFFEYTWSNIERFTLVAGMRVDDNNLYGLFWTPRMHFRYSLTENTSIKMVGGRGYRTANVIMENMGQLASNRRWVFESQANLPGFGLRPEVAWNYGVNFLHRFRLAYRDATLSLDFYRTDFEDQVITDLENAREVRFYNLEGSSFSNSAQAEFSWSPIRRVDVRVAYRWLEVKADFKQGRVDLPLVSTHRAFTNIGYETKKNDKEAQWKFDATFQWIGDQRIPSTALNDEEFQLEERSDDYFLLNAQVTRVFSKSFEVYVGGENLLNFQQPNAILSAEDPNSEFFDASLVWGPVFGSMVYGGLRWMPWSE